MDYKIEWIKVSREGRISGGSKDGVYVSHTQSAAKSGKMQLQTQIRFGIDVMKRMRFLIGDRVALGFVTIEGEKCLAVRRVTDGGGYALSNPKVKELRGTNKSHGVVKMKRLDMPSGDASLAHCVVADEILFVPFSQIKKAPQHDRA